MGSNKFLICRVSHIHALRTCQWELMNMAVKLIATIDVTIDDKTF